MILLQIKQTTLYFSAGSFYSLNPYIAGSPCNCVPIQIKQENNND